MNDDLVLEVLVTSTAWFTPSPFDDDEFHPTKTHVLAEPITAEDNRSSGECFALEVLRTRCGIVSDPRTYGLTNVNGRATCKRCLRGLV